MRLSTRSRYGLIAVVDLALEYGGDPVSLSYLANSQGISESYLEQLLRILKKAKIVKTSRGVSGGYSLACDPYQLSAGKVISVLEGDTALVNCVGVDAASGSCDKACICAARPLFLKLQNKIDSVLNKTMISDLMNDYLYQKRRLSEI